MVYKSNDSIDPGVGVQNASVSSEISLRIDKAKGQSLDNAVILLPEPVFSHGQL